jgi:small subunit ribosomal protein S17
MTQTSGSIRTRGAVRQGKVVSTKASKTAVVVIESARAVPKYERFEKTRSKIHAHIPDGVAVKEGDEVEFAECRRVSKTKAHVVTRVVNQG